MYDFAVAAVAATAHSPALAFTEVRGVTCGNHRAVEEIVMRPIAKKISGEVKVPGGVMSDAKVLADAAMTVELFYGEAKVASVQTDAAHRVAHAPGVGAAQHALEHEAVRAASGREA